MIGNEHDRLTKAFFSRRSLLEDLYQDLLTKQAARADLDSFRIGSYWYRSVRPLGLREPIFVRSGTTSPSSSESGNAEVVLDINQVREKFPHGDIGFLRPSPDGLYVAFAIAEHPGAPYRLFIKKPNEPLEQARYIPLPDEARSVVDSQWGADSHELFVTYGFGWQAQYLGTLNNLPNESSLVALKKCAHDEQSMRIARLEGGATVIADCESAAESSISLVPIGGEFHDLVPLAGIRPGMRYVMHQSGSTVLAAEFSQHENPRLYEVTTMLPHHISLGKQISLPNDFILEDFRGGASAFILGGRKGISCSLLVLDPQSHDIRTPDLPFEDCSIRFLPGESDSSGVRIVMENYASPPSRFRVDVLSNAVIPEGSASGPRFPLETKTFWAESSSKTKIPVTVVHAESDSLNFPRPTVLYGYGAYGVALTPRFMPEVVVLVERGFRVAFAHVRGGGELGPAWHWAATGRHKTISFDDFRACAEFLVQQGMAHSSELFAWGRSAGGLLVASTATQFPELFAGIILDVPFLSVRRTMNDPSSPFRARECAEWGNPEEEVIKNVLAAYDPVMRLPQTSFPDTYMNLAAQDEVIDLGEALRWARLVRAQSPRNKVLINIKNFESHSGAATTEDALREKAYKMTFLLDLLAVRTSN